MFIQTSNIHLLRERGVKLEHTLTSNNLFSLWPALEVAEFYVPPVPVFVLPGSVFDGVPPSDRSAKQRRSALALQTTPGALTKPCLPPHPFLYSAQIFCTNSPLKALAAAAVPVADAPVAFNKHKFMNSSSQNSIQSLLDSEHRQ